MGQEVLLMERLGGEECSSRYSADLGNSARRNDSSSMKSRSACGLLSAETLPNGWEGVTRQSPHQRTDQKNSVKLLIGGSTVKANRLISYVMISYVIGGMVKCRAVEHLFR